MANDSSIVTVDAMLDTSFTDWLAINIQRYNGSYKKTSFFKNLGLWVYYFHTRVTSVNNTEVKIESVKKLL